jgi:hypothetical protein
LSCRNDGPRSGVIHALEFSLVHLPTLFELMASMPSSQPTITVEGKGSIGLTLAVTLQCDQIVIDTALSELQRDDQDSILVAD